ncbi:MAG: adenylate kinase [Candidatus Izemoplasmatales bacterium]|nr:adenylate kinase [Candidatus Izemoplasmatales bacterium]
MNLLIMGKPGAGKGTQAARLLDYYKLTHISTGDIYREEMAKDSPIGILAKKYIGQGELVPDNVTNDIVRNVLNQKDYPNGFMLDGYPRTKTQAIALDKMLEDLNIHLTAVINVDVEDKVLLVRMAGRRVCSNCGATYHIDFHPSAKEGICDVCGSKLIQREDDLEESVLNRLRIYNEKTKPLLDYYKKKGLLLIVNGEDPTATVFQNIVNKLGE